MSFVRVNTDLVIKGKNIDFDTALWCDKSVIIMDSTLTFPANGLLHNGNVIIKNSSITTGADVMSGPAYNVNVMDSELHSTGKEAVDHVDIIQLWNGVPGTTRQYLDRYMDIHYGENVNINSVTLSADEEHVHGITYFDGGGITCLTLFDIDNRTYHKEHQLTLLMGEKSKIVTDMDRSHFNLYHTDYRSAYRGEFVK